ncbi:MAG: site-specific DNA-methyltransferase, partial [Spirochaetaceae bacterium]|nr:site-specific DNA-methyltransferase [Spirochaetaceae bacterium]
DRLPKSVERTYPTPEQLPEVKEGLVPQTIWTYRDVGHTQDAKKMLLQIFPDDLPVFTTKPVELLKRILLLSTDKDSIVLDSFAGSGTTAHAVLALNQEDGGNRRFVLIECEDYADSITAERVRRVIKGVPSAKDANLRAGLGGSFSYFELGGPMQQESLLSGGDLPDYEALAGYVFFTATGDQFDPGKIDRETGFIGRSERGDVYLIYEPDRERIKDLALTLD